MQWIIKNSFEEKLEILGKSKRALSSAETAEHETKISNLDFLKYFEENGEING